MSDVAVIPDLKKELLTLPNRTAKGLMIQPRKKEVKKSVTTKSRKSEKQKIRRLSGKHASSKKVAVQRQRIPFHYLRVLKMWQAGKSSMAIAKAIGRYDSKAADPMHSFRVTLTRFHKGVRINGKLVRLPHRVSKAALKRATKAGKKAAT